MVRRAPGPGPAWARRRPGGGRGTWGPLLHLAKGIAAELQRCHPLAPETALKGSGAGNGAPYMVLAAIRRACGARGRRPMGSLGRRHRGWWDVRPTRRAAAVRSRSVARTSRTLLALLAATWDRPPAGALDWDGRSDCPWRRRRRWGPRRAGLSLGPLPAQRPERPADRLGEARLGGPSAGSVVGRAGRPVDVAALTRQARSCRFFCPSGADVFGTPLAGRVRWGLARRAKRSKNGL